MTLTLRAPALAAAALALALALPHAAAAQAAPVAEPTAVVAGVKDLPLTLAQRQIYLGSYTISTPDGQTMIFRVFEEEGVLKGQPGDQEIKRLFYQGDNVFVPEGEPDFTLTFTVAGDRAASFVAKNPDMTIEAIRNP